MITHCQAIERDQFERFIK